MRLAIKHHVSSEVALQAVRDAHLPKNLYVARIEWHKLFPKAPSWNPASEIRAPRLVLLDPARKWGKIEKKKVILKVGPIQHEIRIQRARLFRHAPKWSPLHKVTLPALRLVAKRAESNHKIKLEKKIKQERQQRH